MSRLNVVGFSGLLCLVLAAGCASDPAKNASDAHDKQLEDQRKSTDQQITTQADMTVQGAQQDRKSDTASGVPVADAKMTEARRVAQTKAQERLDKADAKIRELKGKLANAGGKAPTSARDSVTTVDTQRGLVQREMDGFSTVTNDGFDGAKSHLDADLDTLESLIVKSDKEVSKTK